MHYLDVDASKQQLLHYMPGNIVRAYTISTAINGLGEEGNSEKTPRGWHIVRAKIGANVPINTVFRGRRPTGEIFYDALKMQYPNRDWILTRILWLSGLEIGKNRLGNCDTMRRYIYIHGVPDSNPVGIPGSKGCINMRNEDIIQLFDEVPLKTKIYIHD